MGTKPDKYLQVGILGDPEECREFLTAVRATVAPPPREPLPGSREPCFGPGPEILYRKPGEGR